MDGSHTRTGENLRKWHGPSKAVALRIAVLNNDLQCMYDWQADAEDAGASREELAELRRQAQAIRAELRELAPAYYD